MEANDFYRETHRDIYRAILAVYEGCGDVDPITVSEQLRADGCLDKIGGPSYLSGLLDGVGTAANAPHYARTILSRSVQRKLIHAAEQIAEMNYLPVPPQEIGMNIAQAVEIVMGITGKQRSKVRKLSMPDMREMLEEIEQRMIGRYDAAGINTGLRDLDMLTGGFQNGELVVLGGRPSMGKSALAFQISADCKTNVLFFSLEASYRQCRQRLLSRKAKLNLHCIRTGRGIGSGELGELIRSAVDVAELNIWFDDTARLTAQEIRAKARRLAQALDGQGQRLGLVVVDHLHIMGGFKDEQEKITHNTGAMKALAKELDLPTLLLAQLNRDVGKRTGKERRPTMTDYRACGSIEQDADIMLAIHREYYYTRASDDYGKAEILVLKHRDGQTGEVNCCWIDEYATFVDRYEG